MPPNGWGTGSYAILGDVPPTTPLNSSNRAWRHRVPLAGLVVGLLACTRTPPPPPVQSTPSPSASPTPSAEITAAIGALLADTGGTLDASAADRKALAGIYPSLAPLWVDRRYRPTKSANHALAALNDAAAEGLDPSDYRAKLLSTLAKTLEAGPPAPDSAASFATLPRLPPALKKSVKPGGVASGLDACACGSSLWDLLATAAPLADGSLYEGELVEGVKRFQMRHGIEGDGILGPATWTALAASSGRARLHRSQYSDVSPLGLGPRARNRRAQLRDGRHRRQVVRHKNARVHGRDEGADSDPAAEPRLSGQAGHGDGEWPGRRRPAGSCNFRKRRTARPGKASAQATARSQERPRSRHLYRPERRQRLHAQHSGARVVRPGAPRLLPRLRSRRGPGGSGGMGAQGSA